MMVVAMILLVMKNICHYQQSFVFSMPFWELVSIFTHTSESYLQMLAKGEGKDMKKKIALDLRIAMFVFDIILCSIHNK